MPYWRAYYHLVWGTRDRVPMITDEMQDPIERVIRDIAHEHKALVHAVGFMPDHVHVVTSIPPAIAVSTIVGKMKGSSSHLVNAQALGISETRFGWQSEFGMTTFGEKNLDAVVSYTNSQVQRHLANRLWPSLEGRAVEKNRPDSPG